MCLKLVIFFSVMLAMACGGSKHGAAPAAATTSNKSAGPAHVREDGMPAWVARGGAAIAGPSGRVFYGVGAASGIRNPPLLRSTADNRARDDLAKIFEVFSASLMKDYSASTGEQNVEQAIKTMSSAALSGVVIVDHYIGKDGTMYALAELDLEKAMKAVKEAKELGAVRSYVEKVTVDDIFDKHGKKPEPPPAVIAQAQPDAPKSVEEKAVPPPTAEATSGAKMRSGPQPGWVEGQDPNFPYETYLCGVGFGADRTAAENAAYAGLARIFVVNVSSISKDFMGAYQQTGAKSLEISSSETLTKVSTAKVFSGVRIMEVWRGDQFYALACLDREKASQTLRGQIHEADSVVSKHLDKAKNSDAVSKLKELGKALDTLVQREAFNGELRIVDVNGVGMAGDYSHADVAAALEEAAVALRVGVKVEGNYDSDVRTALIEGLSKRGYQISETDSEKGLDVVVSAKVRIEDGGAGAGAGAGMFFARGVIQIEVKNVAQGKVIAALDDNRKEGHRSKEEAERRAVRELAKKIVSKVGAKIDDAMKGR